MVDYDLKMVGIEPPGEGITVCGDKCFDYTSHAFATNEKIREQ
jgi:GDPmannose 4,6-dehydratase